jgi:hypothetical protein
MYPRCFASLMIFSILIISGCSALAASPVPTNPQYPQYPPVSTSSQTLTLTAPAWIAQNIREPDLKDIAAAVTIIYHFAPETRQFIDAAAAKHISMQWASLPKNVAAAYHPATDRILVDNELRGTSIADLSSAIIHEVQHSMENYDGSVGGCLTDELASFSIEAITWMRLRDKFRAGTLPTRERFLDDLLTAYQTNKLIPFVLNIETYWRQCKVPAHGEQDDS